MAPTPSNALPHGCPGRPAGRPSSKIKLGLNAFSFDDALKQSLRELGTSVSLLQLLEFCAERDFEAIDPTGYYFPGRLPGRALRRVRERV